MGWPSKLRYTARNALKPGYARVMTGKLVQRARRDEHRRDEAIAWARPRAQRIAEWCEATDADLWREAKQYGTELRGRADELGRELGVHIGGGGRVEFLYFVTRLRRPRTVVETGVLHGYSSAAFLAALDRNGDGGRLWSSDFPYFREKEPERLVGVLVPEHLRSQWTLRLEGDRRNLPAILDEVADVDLFHYDSDKTYAGRRFAIDLVMPHLAPAGVVLMDDVQDNLFFRDWVPRTGKSIRVFGSTTAFVGAIGL
jgi:predicted O-methyltransferase YrrM